MKQTAGLRNAAAAPPLLLGPAAAYASVKQHNGVRVHMPKQSFVTLALLAFVVVGAPIHAQTPPADSAEIRTEATGRRSVRPDLATVTLQFHAVDSTPRRAGERLAVRADSIRRALVTLGIPRDSLLTGSRWYWWAGRVEVIPQSQCVPSANPRVGCTQVVDTTYRIRESIEVRIRDLSKIGAVIDAALAHGITDISPIRFSATDVRVARAEALREATLRAREQAEVIATAGGGRIGRVISLSTQADYRDRYSGLDGIVVTSASEAASATEVTAPSVSVAVTVYGRWRFDPRP